MNLPYGSNLKAGPPDHPFNYVLIRADRQLDQSLLFQVYGEAVNSRAIDWRGKTVHAIFAAQEPTAARARRLGWQDITAEFRRAQDGATEPVPAAPVVLPSTEVPDGGEPPFVLSPVPGTAAKPVELGAHALEILYALRANGPMRKADLTKLTNLTDSQYTVASSELVKKGVCEWRGKSGQQQLAIVVT